MGDKLTYNGTPVKRKFHKLKKYYTIIKRTLSYKSQIKKIRKYNNSTLNHVLDAILMVKESGYSLEDKKVFGKMEEFRNKLSNDKTTISYEVFDSDVKREVSQIYKIAASPKIWAQFLYCLAKYSNSKSVLEIGTNVGVSGAYILNALEQKSNSYFVSMEGVPQLCEISNNYFETITSKDRFEIMCGLYKDTFPKLLEKERKFDLLFIDGNHQKEPTIAYFNQLMHHIGSSAIFVFDDIYYSTEMIEAWNIIKDSPGVNYSIDMYKLGVIVIDQNDSNRNIPLELHISL